jgi:hypothetical protein
VLEIKEPISYEDSTLANETITHDKQTDEIQYNAPEAVHIVSYDNIRENPIEISIGNYEETHISRDETVPTNVHISRETPTAEKEKMTLPKAEVLPQETAPHSVTYVINYGQPKKTKGVGFENKEAKTG